ncbi:MAG: hypothetical protein K5697_15120 [Lachnospiraceae bacterium]|nr:hypothetical protein [Lachnospiraceae bacterium]
MKYSTEEALSEIEKRSREIEKAEDKKKGMLLSAATFCLTLVLIPVIAVYGNAGTVTGAGSAYGSFFIAAEYGGYVLTGLVSFVAGVALTLLIRSRQKCGGDEEKKTRRNMGGRKNERKKGQ